MTEVTRVPLQPIAKGSLTKLWLGVAAAVALGAGVAWAAMPAGVSIETVTEGSGESPGPTDVVFVKYTGKLADGTVFDQSQPANWPVPGILPDGAPMALDQVIPGFRDAMVQMQKGGKYTVEIPSDMAYGASPPPGAPIPPNADLVFDVEMVDFMTREEAEARYNRMMQAMQQQMPAMGPEGAMPAPQGAPQ
ncbi:FKBP-type peptidyl-prolyl cis-trans isomerase [Aurantiacibacter suaedae]|uniref:FKBP-type peptidyl-prolyl cis-trans isomerase n=1 Tax=Aurantiacibacter suaedae TaxID=2545755 RepID=UPI0010F94568|nr:FKBP-type peptidyl-prolyl cis-trans isomerase [Aurantiacibacter suaedae]